MAARQKQGRTSKKSRQSSHRRARGLYARQRERTERNKARRAARRKRLAQKRALLYQNDLTTCRTYGYPGSSARSVRTWAKRIERDLLSCTA